MEKLKSHQKKINSWLENRTFQVVLGVLALILAYVFASLAIDSGSLLDYAITLLLIYVGISELFFGIRKFIAFKK